MGLKAKSTRESKPAQSDEIAEDNYREEGSKYIYFFKSKKALSKTG